MMEAMHDIMDLWTPLLHDFKREYPELALRFVGWCPHSETEILVEIDDGAVYNYNSSDGSIGPYFKSRRLIEDVNEQEWRDNFSLRLRTRMRRTQITSDELSEATGISRIMISRYMNGRATPSLYNSEKIADVLGCYVRDLTVFKKERKSWYL